MGAERVLERWHQVGGGVLKSVLAFLLLLVLAVFAYLAHSTYASRAGYNAVTSPDSSLHAAPESQKGAAPSGAAAPRASGERTEQGLSTADGVAPPANDTISPNPPNGMTFGGQGHFQLYRQGDITWRLNTTTGETCIVFATNEAWKQPRVRRAACPKG